MKKFFLILGILIGLWIGMSNGRASEEAWVLCQPDSYVNVRIRPKTSAKITGKLYSGDRIYLDGRSMDGFYHVTGVASEAGDGWVSKGFIVYCKPVEDGHTYRIEASGRVACRRGVDGIRRRWLHTDDILTVYMRSEDWCLTSQGFVQTKYIDLSTPMDIRSELNPDDMTWEMD